MRKMLSSQTWIKNIEQKLPVANIFISEDIPLVLNWGVLVQQYDAERGGVWRERERVSMQGGVGGMAVEFLDAVCARTEC